MSTATTRLIALSFTMLGLLAVPQRVTATTPSDGPCAITTDSWKGWWAAKTGGLVAVARSVEQCEAGESDEDSKTFTFIEVSGGASTVYFTDDSKKAFAQRQLNRDYFEGEMEKSDLKAFYQGIRPMKAWKPFAKKNKLVRVKKSRKSGACKVKVKGGAAHVMHGKKTLLVAEYDGMMLNELRLKVVVYWMPAAKTLAVHHIARGTWPGEDNTRVDTEYAATYATGDQVNKQKLSLDACF